MKCEECNGDIIRDGNDLICEVCGVVYQEEKMVAHKPCTHDSEERRKLISHEGHTSYSAIGKGLGGNGKIPHLYIHGGASKNDLGYKEAALGKTLAQMRSLCNKLHLPKSVMDESGRLLRQVKTFKGRSAENIMLCVIFSSAKLCHCPRSMYRIMTASGTAADIKTLRKVLKWCRRELNIPPVVNGAEEYISQVASDIDTLGECVEVGAQTIIEKLKGSVSGWNPIVTAAAAILIAKGIQHPYDYAEVEEIAQASGVSSSAIISRSKQLREL